jgi:DNA polymerase-3 subunit epsilon
MTRPLQNKASFYTFSFCKERPLRHIVLDTETTGWSKQTDRVVEIAAVEFNPDTGLTGDFYHVYLNPEKWMPDEVQRVHGISNAYAATQPLFVQEAAGFVGFIRDARLYIHNAPFDTYMLDAEFGRLGLDGLASYVESIVCTLTLARSLYPGKKNTLDAFGVSRTKRKQHGARIDCELLAQVTAHLKAAKEGRILVIPEKVSGENWLKTMVRRCFGGSSTVVQ